MRWKVARHFPASRAQRELLRRPGRHRLRIEPLEPRAMLAADMGLISGTVFSDLTGDGKTADDELLAGVMVELFGDGGDMAPGGDDTLVDTRSTDASGGYAFADLAAGRYFVRQTVPDGYVTRPGENLFTVDISEEQAAGITGLAIDSFESAQSASAASNAETIDASTLADPAVLGGERDLFVELLAGMGTIDLDSGLLDMDVLQLSSSETSVVLADVVWDGPDGDGSAIDTTGLGGIDLTDAGGNEMTALLLQAGADQAGAELTIQVFTDADNSSMAVIDVPDTGGLADETFCIRFTDLAVATGSGADFANVGAIRLVLASGEPAVDLQLAHIGTVGPSVFDIDFANFSSLVDVEVTKTDSGDPATAGETLSYTLTVTNNGPSNATGVTVTDTLPEGVTFQSATASQGDPPSEMDGVVTALLGDLTAGASATVTIVVDVGPNTFGTITNLASVAASDPDVDASNNMVSEPTEVEIEPASLAGRVFVDFGNDGLFDGRDVPIPGVTITLTGTDITGAEIDRTMLTDENGRYEFTDLLPGTYRIEETQPGFFPDGQESVGTAGGTALDNVFEMIDLAGGVEGLDYNFAELVPTLSKRQFLASSG